MDRLASYLLFCRHTANNSVQPGGIPPKPGQTTGGNGPVTGQETEISVKFTTPFDLAAGQYFFVPQVELTTASGDFLWLSAPTPIVPPGTPFPPGFTDLQSWTRDQFLDPDWLRIGTDIVGGTVPPTFNAAFTLNGVAVSGPVAGAGLPALVMACGCLVALGASAAQDGLNGARRNFEYTPLNMRSI